MIKPDPSSFVEQYRKYALSNPDVLDKYFEHIEPIVQNIRELGIELMGSESDADNMLSLSHKWHRIRTSSDPKASQVQVLKELLTKSHSKEDIETAIQLIDTEVERKAAELLATLQNKSK